MLSCSTVERSSGIFVEAVVVAQIRDFFHLQSFPAALPELFLLILKKPAFHLPHGEKCCFRNGEPLFYCKKCQHELFEKEERQLFPKPVSVSTEFPPSPSFRYYCLVMLVLSWHLACSIWKLATLSWFLINFRWAGQTQLPLALLICNKG